MTEQSNPFFVTLPSRGLIHMEGADRHEFLQNLITNDLNMLEPGKALYTAMLTPQGKFLHDFFILAGENFYLLDCEGGARAQHLYKHMKLYKLRSDVQISVEETHPVYAVFGQQPETGTKDPRHSDMGWRTFDKPAGMEEKPFDVWDERRLRLTIPDGSRDMAVKGDTALDCNMDIVNGVSFEKGCYVGQEITVRMHLRNIIRKRLYTLEITGPVPEPFTDIHVNGKLVGQMRSHCGAAGLALLKKDAVGELEDSPFRVIGSPSLRAQ